MKIKLKVNERFALLSILPKRGAITKVRKVKQLMDQLFLNDEEKNELHVIDQGGQTHWDEKLDKGKTFEIDSLIKKIVAKDLKKKSDEEKLTTNLVVLYDLFVEGKYGNDSAEDSESEASDQASSK